MMDKVHGLFGLFRTLSKLTEVQDLKIFRTSQKRVRLEIYLEKLMLVLVEYWHYWTLVADH